MTRLKLAVLGLLTLCAFFYRTPPAIGQASCGPAALGSPCAPGDLASAGTGEPILNPGIGNPVHLATGNKYVRDVDMPSGASAPGIELVRHYNSQQPERLSPTPGWRWSYDVRLIPYGDRRQVRQADGSLLFFTGAGENLQHPTHGTLNKEGGQWRWQWPDGRQLWFGPSGYLVSLVQGPEQRIDIDRLPAAHAAPHAIRTVRRNQRTLLRFHYQPSGNAARLAAIDTPLGRFHYDYDAENRLVTMRRPDGMQRHYLFEPGQQSGNRHALTGITLETPSGRHRQRLRTWHYDAQNRVVQSADTPGDTISLHYISSPTTTRPGQTRVSGPHGRRTQFHIALTPRGHRVVRVIHRDCTACEIRQGSARYDAHGRATRINGIQIERDATGATRTLRWGRTARGWPHLVMHFDRTGRRTAWETPLTGSEQMHYHRDGIPRLQRFANGDSRRIDVDAQRRPTRITQTRHDGQDDIADLRWHGRRLQQIRHAGETETRRHDRHGRLIERRIARPGIEAGSTPLDFAERFHYDARHRLVKHELPEGGALLYDWHASGRLARLRWEPENSTPETVIDSAPSVAGYRYGNGMRLWVAQHHRTRLHDLNLADRHGIRRLQRTRFDGEGRLRHESDILETHTATRRTARQFGYDLQQRLATAQGHTAVTGQAERRTRRFYAWNDDGSSAAASINGITERPDITRDASGLPLRVGNRILHYGANRRLAAVQENGTTLARFGHNAFGHRISKHTSAGTTHYFYLDNRVVAQARTTSPSTTRSTAGAPGPHITQRFLYAGHALVGLIDYTGSHQADGHDTGEKAASRGMLFFVHSSRLGAPQLVTNAEQREVWQADYTPSGLASTAASALDLPLRLPGQLFDAETGWHDNLYRTYLPVFGHYLEPDPLGPLPVGDALGYAAQQPGRFLDPLGLLLFAFDGTRQDPSTQSNVWKMSQAYQDGPVFYQAGPGQSAHVSWDALTGYSGDRILQQQWQRFLQQMAALNGSTETTPLDIIGFSRGAALARHFGNQIAEHTQAGLFRYSHPYLGELQVCLDLRFMGLFDTVAQFGINGSRNTLYNLTLSSAWQWIAHAVALQERRWLFPLSSAGDTHAANVVEAPFVGAHADIGGGYLTIDDHGAPRGGDLSDVALNWMVWQARATQTDFRLADADRDITTPYLHDERSSTLRYLVNGDRAVLNADGTHALNYQHEHAVLGERARLATEAFIARHADWLTRPAGEPVADVDMAGYAKWLNDTLGWRQPPA
jgi:RHS repeat-associated protein